jgi:hypothetical protein
LVTALLGGVLAGPIQTATLGENDRIALNLGLVSYGRTNGDATWEARGVFNSETWKVAGVYENKLVLTHEWRAMKNDDIGNVRTMDDSRYEIPLSLLSQRVRRVSYTEGFVRLEVTCDRTGRYAIAECIKREPRDFRRSGGYESSLEIGTIDERVADITLDILRGLIRNARGTQ